MNLIDFPVYGGTHKDVRERGGDQQEGDHRVQEMPRFQIEK